MKIRFLKIIIPIALMLFALIMGCLSLVQNEDAPIGTDDIAQEQPQEAEIENAEEEQNQEVISGPPVWLDILPENEDIHYFVGKSIRARSERIARQLAEADGRKQCAAFITQEIGAKGLTVTISGLQTKEYYTETLFDDNKREIFVVYVLMEIDKKVLNSLIERNKATEKPVEKVE